VPLLENGAATMTIREALARGTSLLLRRDDLAEWAVRDAHLLLQHVLGSSREYVMAWPERTLTSAQAAGFDHAISERLRAVPVQYLRGTQEFYGREFIVTPDVLIPRPETELLIDEVKRYIEPEMPVMIADVGTGSGAIAVTLAAELAMARVTAFDISAPALAVAGRNTARHGVSDRMRLIQSDLLARAEGRVFDCIVSNPPYIATADRESLHPQVRDHEPALALFGGFDGFDLYRRLIPEAWKHLRPGGLLMMEIGKPGRAIDWHLMSFSDVYTVNDLQGLPRLVVARKP